MVKPIWSCKVGMLGHAIVPNAADGPMRIAVETAFEQIIGVPPQFVLSGWSAKLTEYELAVVEDRAPEPGKLPVEARCIKDVIIRRLDELLKMYRTSLEKQELTDEARTRYLGSKVALEDIRDFVTDLRV